MMVKDIITKTATEIENELNRLTGFDASLKEAIVFEAMRYSLLGGGKRIRAIFVVKLAEMFSGNKKAGLLVGSAIEMIHAYSLIHDDLPCMDDDKLRRGKPTCHVAYGEAVALLAGDALLNSAFELLSSEELSSLLTPEKQIAIIRRLSKASGRYGMIGGQTIDIESEGKPLAEGELSYLHSLKTGELITASLVLGGIIGDCNELDKLENLGKLIGLAFQVQDDYLDITSDAKTLGKDIGSDSENNKTTYVTLLGVEESKALSDKLYNEAIEIARSFKDNEFLVGFLEYMRQRNR